MPREYERDRRPRARDGGGKKSKRYAGLPAWGWVAVAVIGVGGYLYEKRKSATTTTASTGQTAGATTGYQPSGYTPSSAVSQGGSQGGGQGGGLSSQLSALPGAIGAAVAAAIGGAAPPQSSGAGGTGSGAGGGSQGRPGSSGATTAAQATTANGLVTYTPNGPMGTTAGGGAAVPITPQFASDLAKVPAGSVSATQVPGSPAAVQAQANAATLSQTLATSGGGFGYPGGGNS